LIFVFFVFVDYVDYQIARYWVGSFAAARRGSATGAPLATIRAKVSRTSAATTAASPVDREGLGPGVSPLRGFFFEAFFFSPRLAAARVVGGGHRPVQPQRQDASDRVAGFDERFRFQH
jgi:hypothetical protein